MKYAVLAAALAFGVPAMAAVGFISARLRGYLFSLLLCTTVLGAHGSVNLLSRELYRGPDRGFEITTADLVCWALIAVLIARFYRRLDWFPRNFGWLLLFFLYAAITGLFSAQPLYSAFSLWKCVRIFLLYWCTVNCIRIGIDRKYLWLGYVAAASVLTVLAVQQKLIQGIYRISGPFDHSNTVPLYANLILPVLLIWALRDNRLSLRAVVLSVALCLGLLFSVLSTFSRAGIALSGAAVVVALLWSNLGGAPVRARLASLSIALLLMLGAIRAAIPLIERIRTAPAASAGARDEFNYAAQLMLQDHPFGIGLNDFSYVLTNREKYREHFEVMKSEEQGGVAHHIYWLTAAELGYFGLALYLVIIARFMWIALSTALRDRSLNGRLCFGIFLGFCTLQASGFYEWAFRQTPVMQLFAISAGLAVSWSKLTPRRKGVRASRVGVQDVVPAPELQEASAG